MEAVRNILRSKPDALETFCVFLCKRKKMCLRGKYSTEKMYCCMSHECCCKVTDSCTKHSKTEDNSAASSLHGKPQLSWVRAGRTEQGGERSPEILSSRGHSVFLLYTDILASPEPTPGLSTRSDGDFPLWSLPRLCLEVLESHSPRNNGGKLACIQPKGASSTHTHSRWRLLSSCWEVTTTNLSWEGSMSDFRHFPYKWAFAAQRRRWGGAFRSR